MKGGLKRGKRNFNTLENQKKQAKDEWNTAFHNFKKKEVMNGRVCSMNQKTANHIMVNGVDISKICFMKKRNWIQLTLVWLIISIAFNGRLESSYEAKKGVSLIIIIVMSWNLWDIINKFKQEAIYASSYIYAAVQVNMEARGDKILDSFKEEEQKRTNILLIELLHKLLAKVGCLFLLIFISVCILSGYLIYWDVSSAILFGFFGIPITIILLTAIYCIFRKKMKKL